MGTGDTETEKQWKKFIKLDGISEVVTPEEFKLEMENERTRILNILNSGSISRTCTGFKGALNYFIINNSSYGGICEKCGNNGIVVLLMGKSYIENLDRKIWVPSLETYMSKGITPGDDTFKRSFPVPVDTDTDYWYYPRCNELHKFKYNSILGLIYDQKII